MEIKLIVANKKGLEQEISNKEKQMNNIYEEVKELKKVLKKIELEEDPNYNKVHGKIEIGDRFIYTKRGSMFLGNEYMVVKISNKVSEGEDNITYVLINTNCNFKNWAFPVKEIKDIFGGHSRYFERIK